MKSQNLSDTGKFVMFRISIHPEPHISVEAHPHPDTPKADRGAHPHTRPPVSVTPGIDFSALGESGRHSGLLGRLPASHPGFIRVILPGDASAYYIKSDATKGLHQLYRLDPSTGAFKQTSKQVATDGKGGWRPDGGLKGGLNYSPEARAARLEKATERHRDAVRDYRSAKRLVSSNRRDVIASKKTFSNLKKSIEKTEKSVESKTRIVEHYESIYTNAVDDMTGAYNQLKARRTQFNRQPHDEATLSRFTVAKERYDEALQHSHSADHELRSAKSELAQERDNLDEQRQALAEAEYDLSLDEAVQTTAENDLAKAKVKLKKAEEELEMAQA
jgi:hypothetical protein